MRLGETFHPDRLRSNPAAFAGLLAMLAAIGLLRTVVEVALGIRLDAKWFSFAPDVLFAMAAYPAYLCFFHFMFADLLLRRFHPGYGRREAERLFLFFVWIQFAHFLIPLFDWVQLHYGIPARFHPYLNAQRMGDDFTWNPFSELPGPLWIPVYLTPAILLFTRVTTLGINVTWVVVGVLFARFLWQAVGLRSWPKIAAVMLVLFQIIYWPVYKYYFVFDRLLGAAFGWDHWQHYGYGVWFCVAGAAAAAYVRIRLRRERS